MNPLLVLHIAFTAMVPTMRPDTPPPLPIPVAQLAHLKTRQDVIAASVLEDGKPAPGELVLPELQNRRQTLEYMMIHYPEKLRDTVTTTMPIAWVFVNRNGKVAEAHMLMASGHPALDSLSLATLSVAWFRPALIGHDSVGLWVPYPARIPPYPQLEAALNAYDFDRSKTPVATPFDHAPEVLNRNQVEAAVIRIVYEVDQRIREFNERMTRAQSAGGTTLLWVYISPTGTVENALVKKTSGNTDLDNSALQVAKIMRFSPALNKGQAVDAWLEVPIKFRNR